MKRFASLVFVLSCVPGAFAQEKGKPNEVVKKIEPDLEWFDAKKLGLEGQAFADTKDPYDRFPARAEKTVPPSVWGLSRQSAGLAVHFTTDAPAIHAKWTLTSGNLAMPHMPATGVSGLDLYVRGENGKWLWLSATRPATVSNQQALVAGIPSKKREYLLYLPLYNGVKSLELGVPKGKAILPVEFALKADRRPIVFYGTSITQGGCASRPGMVHTAILGRWLDRPVVNLGFSGSGRMEAAVGALIAEIDASAYVIDCLPNMNAKEVEERAEPLVRQLRKAHPGTPIILVEDRSYSNSFLIAGSKQRNETSRAALKKAHQNLMAAGVKGLHYLEGEKLLGDDNEGTVDSSHPTDLGFLRQAEAMLPVLRKALPTH